MSIENKGQIVAGSINDLNTHPAYALKKARQVAEIILRDNNATDNERALADCIIALYRNMGRSYDR